MTSTKRTPKKITHTVIDLNVLAHYDASPEELLRDIRERLQALRDKLEQSSMSRSEKNEQSDWITAICDPISDLRNKLSALRGHIDDEEDRTYWVKALYAIDED